MLGIVTTTTIIIIFTLKVLIEFSNINKHVVHKCFLDVHVSIAIFHCVIVANLVEN